VGIAPLFWPVSRITFRPTTLCKVPSLGQNVAMNAIYGATAPITGRDVVAAP
jgi:hypothetical protein